MKLLSLATIISFLLITSSVFALNITLSTDKSKVFLGENFTLKGKIAFDDGSSGTFQYRAAVVAPSRVVICDSNKTATAADGTFSLFCRVPTQEQANSLGIPAALTRAVIPLKPGVVVLDSQKNTTVKKHARVVLAVNPDKFKAKVNEIASNLNGFTKNANVILSECDKIIERAQRFNATSVSDKCQALKDKVSMLISDANNISSQASQLANNASATDLDDFKAGVSIIKDELKDLREELKDIRETIKSIKWETLREVKEIRKTTIQQKINETRGQIKELRERVKDVKKQMEREGS